LKNLVLQNKNSDQSKLIFILTKTRFLNKGLKWKAGGGFKKKLQIDAV
jgi:hypothetical protein